MKRRALLRRAGALGALVLAGCTGDDTDGPGQGNTPTPDGTPDDTPTQTPTPTPTPTPTEPTITDTSIRTVNTDCLSGDSDETARISVDTDERTVTVSGLLRTSNPCHEAVLEAVHYEGATDTLQVNVSAESTDSVCVECVGAVEYEATVTFAGGVPGTVTVSHHGEAITSTGDREATPTPTPGETPTLVDASLSVTDVTQSEQRETADVRFETDTDTVVLQGTIQGSDGCKTAALGAVDYDAAADTLTVNVITKDREGTENRACTEALVYIGYEASIRFEGGLPKVVELSHDGRGIMSGSHSSASASASASASDA